MHVFGDAAPVDAWLDDQHRGVYINKHIYQVGEVYFLSV